MTVETLHDALTLLPADLIAAADKKRNRKPIQLHWHRWAAMAACLAVILSCGLLFRYKLLSVEKTTDSASAVITAQDALTNCVPEEAAEGMPTAGTAAADNVEAACGTSREESPLQDEAPVVMEAAVVDGVRYTKTPGNGNTTACYAQGPGITLVTSRTELDAYRDKWNPFYLLDDFMTVCEDYDDGWFENHDLVLIPVDAVPVTSSVTVTQIVQLAEGWEVHITISQPGEETESTTWHILLEAEKGQLPNEDAVAAIVE